MEPGRELDALIADKIFGRIYENPDDYGSCPTCGYDGKYSALPEYSTDIAAAWEVAEKILEMTAVPGPKGGSRVCAFTVREAVGSELRGRKGYNFSVQFKDYRAKKSIWETGKSAPHAICLAALKFIESQ